MIELPEVWFLRARLFLSLSYVAGVAAAGTVGYAWLWRDVCGTWLRGPRGGGRQPRAGPHARGSRDIRQTTGATVLAVTRDGTPLVNPPGELTLRAGDQLLPLGTEAQLKRLEQLIAAGPLEPRST